jgi:hypothetical protein
VGLSLGGGVDGGKEVLILQANIIRCNHGFAPYTQIFIPEYNINLKEPGLFLVTCQKMNKSAK